MKFLKLTRFTRLLSKEMQVTESRQGGRDSHALQLLLAILAERFRLKSTMLITQTGWAFFFFHVTDL